MKTFLFNPYTGDPRHPSDITSDPEGILIMDPGATTLEAAKPTCNQSLQVARPAIPDGLSERVDAWFAKNTGLGGCSDKDIAELTEIFYAATLEQLEKTK